MRTKLGIFLVGLVVVVPVVLAGCGGSAEASGPGEGNYDSWGVHTQDLPDGRTVDCVIWQGYKSGGIDCDWANAR
jgi:hypothetical protein